DYSLEQKIQESTKLPRGYEWNGNLQGGRSRLREGFKKLETEQVIEVKNGKGICVKKKKPFRIYTSFNGVDEAAHLLEILEVRTALESKAAELAAEHATEEPLVIMQYHARKDVEDNNAGKIA